MIMCRRHEIRKLLINDVVELKHGCCHRFSLLSVLNSTHFLRFASGEEKEKYLATPSAVRQLLRSPSLESRGPSKSFFRFRNVWAPDVDCRVDNLISQSDSL